MKINIKLLFLLLLPTLFWVQTSQGTDLSIPAAKNSIKITVPLTANSDATQLNVNNSLTTIEYTDGLGRPNITVQKAVTYNTKKDLVSVQNYDCYGQVSNQWLPLPVTSGTSIPDPAEVMQQAKYFYRDDMPYATFNYISNNNVDEGPNIRFCSSGEAWHNGDKTKKMTPTISDPTNTQTDLSIRLYGVDGDNVVLYQNELEQFATKVLQFTDEDGHANYTFTDAFGRTLLQRMVNGGENHDTYSIYDDMGHLRFVLSPEASDRMSTAGSYSIVGVNTNGNPLAQYGYAYKYDEKGRCIAKKLPGKDWITMMYDQASHLIFSQDGNQRVTNQWTFYKYDALDRIIQSGTTTITDANSMQTTYNGILAVENYVKGTGYTSNCQLGANSILLTQNYYDTYDFINLPAHSTYKSILTYTAAYPVGYGTKYSNLVDGVDVATLGMLTGTSVSMLDNSLAIVTALYYDNKGRVIRSLKWNDLKGYTRDYYSYSFTGKLLRKFEMQCTSFNITNIVSSYGFKYDFADRLTDIWHKSDNRTDSVKLCSIQYDELGRPNKKILHGGIQTIDYGYNIHNQIKSISSPLFAETLFYQESQDGKHSYFNGNIGSLTWGAGGVQNKQYDFAYDGLNRMTKAKYLPDEKYTEEVGLYDKNGNINLLNRSGCYNLSLTGGGIQEGSLIDNINNTYSGNQLLKSQDATPNQNFVLAKNDFKDDNNSLTTEYLYDKNGNMIADANKGIALIKYNLLNLPEKIYFMNGNKIEYMYDATGVKHKAKYTTALNPLQIPLGQAVDNPSNNVLRKDSVEYSSDYIYKNRKIDKILTMQGYIQTDGIYNKWDYWKYNYSLMDYQGNTRVTLASDYMANHSTAYTASGQIDYYPFGMEITPPTGTNSGNNPYLYSGKEIDRMHGLNEYDFSARWQDAAMPGFTTPDPLAETHTWESPYAYCGGDPVNRMDPTGLEWYTNDDGQYTFITGHDEEALKSKSGNTHYVHVGASITFFGSDGTQYYGDPSGNVSVLFQLPEVTIKPNENLYSLYGYSGSSNTNNNGGNSGSENGGEVNNALDNSGKVFDLLDGGAKALNSPLTKFFSGTNNIINGGKMIVGLQKDHFTIGKNTIKTGAKIIVSSAGTWAGAKTVGAIGFDIGWKVGLLFDGVGAIPGAVIGGAVGIAVGALAGGYIGDKITDSLFDE